jgi:uncharacterized membrane protein
MMLHKIFHMNQSVEETKRRLAEVSAYRHHLAGVERADFTGHGLSHWTLVLPFGFKADFVLNETETENEDTVVFKSLDGDLEIFGMVNFHPIKSGLTEVEVMVNYESESWFFNALDKVFNLGDYFLVKQLRRVRAHFEGIAAPAARPLSFFGEGLHTATT